MSKILDSTILGASTPKIVETLDELCINGQMYDKSSLVPKPLEFLAIPGLGNDIYFNTQVAVDYTHNTCQYLDNSVLMDEKETNTVYIAMNDNKGTKIARLKGEGKERRYDKTIYEGIDASMHYGTQFIHQDSTNIYVLIHSGLKITHIGKIDKVAGTPAWTQIATATNAAKITFLYEFQGDLYFTVSEDFNKFSIVKYNKASMAITVVLTDNGSKATPSNFRVIPSALNADDSFYVVRHDEGFSGIKQLIIKRYVFDRTTSLFTSMQVNLDLSLLPKGFIPSHEQNALTNQYCLYEFKGKNKKDYVVLTSNVIDAKFYLFEKVSSTNFVFKQLYNLETTFKTCVPYNQNKTFIMCNQNMIYFYNFNEADEKFELTAALAKEYKRLGIDKNQNLWIQMNDNSVEAISNAMPVKIETLFQEDGYEYANEEIETLLLVYAADFKGGMISTQLELTLVGPAYFSSNNSKKINITTSTSTVIQVPVKITGSGFVKAIANII